MSLPRSKAILFLAAHCIVGVTLLLAWFMSRRVRREAFTAHPDAGLKVGQCTWYVHQRTQDNGWRLRFRRQYGRDAKAWPELVSNASLSSRPEPHSILVFDGWPANPYGHVAYVESVESDRSFTITHANWPIGEKAANRQGAAVYRAGCEIVRGGVKVAGGHHVFAIRGYLASSHGRPRVVQ